MKRSLLAIVTCAFCVAAAPMDAAGQTWAAADISALKRWVSAAPRDALPELSTDRLDRAVAASDRGVSQAEATAIALRLAKMHLLGRAGPGERDGWYIVDTDKNLALEPLLAKALESGTLDTFFAMLRPRHSDYSLLRAAYATEPDAGKRQTIARNMERWRWMPHSLGPEFVLVNAATFEASLWQNGDRQKVWRVIVGKKATPTPIFQTTITGVILNPWWDVPASIVRESVGSLVRRNPAAAKARGYVWSDGHYRQKPGPNNALGQMKLVMPNRFSVYMHDTPNKTLFEQDVRAFSHGCIRTGDALDFASTLLEGVKTRAQIDAIVASRKTSTIPLARPVPLYIAYFTAASDSSGALVFQPDIYSRDKRMVSSGMVSGNCDGN